MILGGIVLVIILLIAIGVLKTSGNVLRTDWNVLTGVNDLRTGGNVLNAVVIEKDFLTIHVVKIAIDLYRSVVTIVLRFGWIVNRMILVIVSEMIAGNSVFFDFFRL